MFLGERGRAGSDTSTRRIIDGVDVTITTAPSRNQEVSNQRNKKTTSERQPTSMTNKQRIRPQLDPIPLPNPFPAPGASYITMSPGQWDGLLQAAYDDDFTLLEIEVVDGEEKLARAFKRKHRHDQELDDKLDRDALRERISDSGEETVFGNSVAVDGLLWVENRYPPRVSFPRTKQQNKTITRHTRDPGAASKPFQGP